MEDPGSAPSPGSHRDLPNSPCLRYHVWVTREMHQGGSRCLGSTWVCRARGRKHSVMKNAKRTANLKEFHSECPCFAWFLQSACALALSWVISSPPRLGGVGPLTPTLQVRMLRPRQMTPAQGHPALQGWGQEWHPEPSDPTPTPFTARSSVVPTRTWKSLLQWQPKPPWPRPLWVLEGHAHSGQRKE